MIRKNLIKSLSVIMAAMLAMMTVACGQNTVDTNETAITMAAEEEAGTDTLANTMVSASNIASAESSADKVETVYVTADANGAVNDVIVSEWLKNAASSAALDDSTELKNIVNVKGGETFKDNGDGTLTWDAEGSDIYYQGTTDKQLPVTMKITYTLDGKEISPEELAGKSGKVTIKFEYENNDKQTVEVNGKEVEVYTPFAMVSGMMLDADKFSNVEISNGKVISDGGKTIVMGVALPGLKESLDISEDKWDKLDDADEIKDRLSNSFEITADTTDFELGMTITMASSDILSDFGMTDLSGSDKLDDLKDDMEELNDGANKLVDGAGKLKDGTTDLTDGTKKLYDGATELKDGTQKLYDGTGSLVDGTGKLASGAGTLSDGINKYTDGVSKVKDGAVKLSDGTKQVKAGTAALKKGMEDGNLQGGTQALANGAQGLSEGAGQFVQALTAKKAEAQYQADCYTNIKNWLGSKGAYPLSVPAAPQDIDIDGNTTFLTCLGTVTGGNYTSIEAANAFMNQVKQSSQVLAAISTDPATTTTTQTVVTTMSAEDLFSGLTTDEDEEAYSETTETPIPSGDDNVLSVTTETIPNPDKDEEGEKEVTEPEVTVPVTENNNGKTDETVVEPEKKDTTEEKKAEEGQGTPENTDEVKRQVTLTLEDDDEDEDDDVTLNSTKNMIVTKKILNSTPAFTPTQIKGAVTCIEGYNQMLGTAAALEGAATSSVTMIDSMLLPNVTSIKNGADKLAAGAGQFKSGVLKVYEGALALDKGVSDLSDGASQLADGTRELTENSGKLRDGASELADGAVQLNDGAIELRDGAGKLNDGTGELKDGTKELYDGSVELDDGVKQLFDGITKFDDEGIKKIYEAFDGDLSDFTDRLQAIQEAGSSYKTFSGSSDDVDSSVKFIIKTDSIKNL
ncbi:hypothetical protein D6855_00690 [Butyrivibrio sp. CB08]|uniref:hypothetical protein n=1 Tax=Butyrivibrio sp. CB08 TaxID=2364879 RepID=UPI000EAA0418|nr:hypothetical protein [Butyrivibrio sp. CB08]RKM61967.1 hypothetical protein D6855_00690 [Butyrivibrio sp. CB08]